MEQYRRQAKALLKAVRAGDDEAVERARAVLGARERFLLSDAQHVVARERGHRTWPELKRAEESRSVTLVDSGLRYTDAEPVLVRVRRRLHRYDLDDRRAAARLAGLPPGWREPAEAVVAGLHCLNLDRRGGVFVGTVGPECVADLTRRVADASLALYVLLLDLDE